MNIEDTAATKVGVFKKVFIGNDHAGLPLKKAVTELLANYKIEVADLGTNDVGSVDYPDQAAKVCLALQSEPLKGQSDACGILICGTGVGMSMKANRYTHVRAVVCSEAYSAHMARCHNDANVLCLGARVVGAGLAQDIVETFLEGVFEGGRHQGRIAKFNSE